jgi:ABC-type nickel/cobalt efflux system permease component RcnA
MLEVQRWLYETATSELKILASRADIFVFAHALGIAALFGFVHALMPGHGKVALVSYYLGRPARIIGGLGTSVVLILAHVGSAVVLVLAGFRVIRATLGGVGRVPLFEAASAALITVIGTWLFVRAISRDHDHAQHKGGILAFVTGLVPCPLTTFIMVYAAANRAILTGLFVTAAMAAGMIATIFILVACTIILRERGLRLLDRTAAVRERIGSALEMASALMIVAFGVWLFATRAL